MPGRPSQPPSGQRGSSGRAGGGMRSTGGPQGRAGASPRKPGPPPAAAPVDRARQAALDTLSAVQRRDAYANLVLPGLLRERHLDRRDAAFATELAYGALRAQGTLDVALQFGMSRPMENVEPVVRDVLRLGAQQILRMRVPPHAAVGATVDLARAVAGHGAATFVNAVLRRLSERAEAAGGDLAKVTEAPAMAEDPVGHLALVTCHPAWIVQSVHEALGGADWNETAAALQADDAPAGTHLVARSCDRGELLAAARTLGEEAAPGRWSARAVIMDGGDPGALPQVRDGSAAVQDEGSQLVAIAAQQAPRTGRDLGLTVDLCSGPGGKSALLAHLGAKRLVSIEPHQHRAALVEHALEHAPGKWLVVGGDGTEPPLAPGSADLVLVDVPCSGLGALRRRPEARWRRTPADVDGLQELQRDLLRSALAVVRPGGVVAYVTCSPHPHETVDVVRAVLAGRGDLELLDATKVIGVDDCASALLPRAVQLWPHRHGTDAMFLALLRRL